MKTGEAERHIKEQLKEIYEDREAVNIADLAIEHITGFSRSARLAKKEESLSAYHIQNVHEFVRRLQLHEPIQYIMNKSWFYGLELFVDNHVLIPRPETEELVHWIIKDMQSSKPNVFDKRPMKADETNSLKILDVGTGSGCIALALKKAMPLAEVWGCDTSDDALSVARRNGSALDIRVDFQGIDFLDLSQQKQLPSVDVIVSNPPYIPISDKDNLQRNVLDYEPHTALFVPGDDPLLFYKSLVAFSRKRLYPNGSIYMEIHEDLGKDVVLLFESEGYKLELRKDMQGKDRMLRVSGRTLRD